MSVSDNGDAAKLPQPESGSPEGNAADPLIEPTLKTATKYQALMLAYLASVAATLAGLGYLGYNSKSLDGWEVAVGVVFTCLPLMATFFTLTLPAWRKKLRERQLRQWSVEGRETRTGYFRIGPYEDNEVDWADFTRADRAHEQVLRWVREAHKPLLFLTGASGAGKSSLLNAHVIPQLRVGQPPTRVITLRSFDDPLASLCEQLLTPDVVWQKPPAADERIEPLKLLRDACEYLGKRDERLLLVFDQFEELLILHEDVGQDSSLSEPDADRRGVGASIIGRVQRFLRAVNDEPPARLRVLLSLRTDYEGMLGRLELPPLEQGRNWLKIGPFTERAARDFLAGGFDNVGPKLLDRVMQEAASVEETRGLIRPITLNMLGAVLNRLAGELSEKEHRGGLLAADLRRTLAVHELRDHAAEVLAALLTDAGTKHPRSVGQLQATTGLAAETIEGCLLSLNDRGLVRRLNRASRLADRVWEISHDFAARLILMILHAPHRSLWHRLRPLVLPTSIAIWLLVFAVLLPGYIRGLPHRAAERLRKEFDAKVTPPVDGRGWRIEFPNSSSMATLDEVGLLLQDINVKSLDLSFNSGLRNVDGLQRVKGLQVLDLSACRALANVDGLQELTGLRTIHLSGCETLTNVDGLGGLTGLQRLDLASCDALTNVDGLQGLTGLQSLDLSACDTLTRLDGLHGLTGLQSLDLAFCSALTSVDVLQSLTGLQSLDLSDCGILTNVDVLQGLKRLRSLDLENCSALTNVNGLQALTELRSLNLAYCTDLTNVDGLQGLKNLEKLDLRVCPGVTDLEPLYLLKSLKRIGLNGQSTTIADEQMQALKQALPQVEIVNGDFESL